MDYFPAFLALDGRPVLLVGGGPVAARKARLLVAAGAELTVVAPETAAEIADLAAAGRARIVTRRFRPSDLDGQWLAVSATGRPEVERCVAAAAERRRIFVNAVDSKANCSFLTPAIVDRSPLIVAISSGGSAPVLARRIRARIEAELPARLGTLARAAGRWRARVATALPEFSRRLRFWETVFDGRLADAGDAAATDRAMANRLEAAVDDYTPAGIAWLVGAGPGDPQLLTLAALQAMQQADVILHDRLVSDAVLALARRDAERIAVGKVPGCRTNPQANINERLVSLVAAGKRVCRLKGGDPFIFGRGGEEAAALDDAGLPYQVIPGITAAAGCAAAAGIPLTHRDVAQSVVFVTAHGKDSIDRLDWPSLARDRQTLAVYMGVGRFETLMRKLTRHGRPADTPIAIIERGTLPEQRIVRGALGQLPMLARAHRIRSPAMLIIGEVTRLGRSQPPAEMAAKTAIENSAIQSV